MKTVDVYWSFRSPYSYLATPDMVSIQEEYEVNVNLRVVMPIAVRDPDILFTEAGKVRVKYIQLDWARRAEFLGLPNKWPSPDPIVQDMETLKISDEQPYIYRLSYLGVEAQRQGKGIEFAKKDSRIKELKFSFYFHLNMAGVVGFEPMVRGIKNLGYCYQSLSGFS